MRGIDGGRDVSNIGLGRVRVVQLSPRRHVQEERRLRFVEVPTGYLRIPDAWGGTDADSDVRHAALYLTELGVALDAFEEDQAALARAGERVKAWVPTGSYATDPFIEQEYFKRRIRLHARSFILSLYQIQEYLEQLNKVCLLSEVGNSLNEFDRAFPTLREIRNSLAHAAERARRGPDLIQNFDATYIRMGLYGYWIDDNFYVTPRAKNVEPLSISITQASLDLATTIIATLSEALTLRCFDSRWPDNTVPGQA